ncbi:MAG: energy transducer TonB [Thermoanaerobaculia bacterium]
MREPIDDQLARRRAQLRSRRRLTGWGPSFALHLGIVLALFVGPRLFADPHEPLEYVSVQIMPLQALGQRDAQPAAEPTRPEPEPPAPEPEIPEPEPEPELPEPDPEATVVEPQPTPEPAPEPEQRPQTPADPTPSQPSTPPPSVPERPPSGEAETSGTPGRLGSPEGDPRGTSPLGTTLGGLDNPDFTYSYYLDQMLALIDEGWRPPVTGERLEAMVHFRILRDGTIKDLELMTSSGNSAFDLAGLRAVQSASPLPPLPFGYRHDTLGVNLILH